jgi:hypothetical protein
MSLLAVALAAVVVAPSPAAHATYRPVATPPADRCDYIDPQFVQFVPPAPLADGRNPLLRLISSQDESFVIQTFQKKTLACGQSLRRTDGPR